MLCRGLPIIMTWMYQGNPLIIAPEDVVGFVYIITNTLTGMQYVGKKLFTAGKIKQVKGKKKKYRVESDWAEYYGSNNKLKADVEFHGKESFEREILHLCTTKGQCSYFEAKEQFARCVLEHPELYYNEQIRTRIHRSHLKLCHSSS